MTIARDLRCAWRSLRRSPAVAALVVLTLSVGIAANGVFFASIYGSTFRPLPFESPQRLVLLNQSRPALGEGRLGVSAPNMRDWIERAEAFQAIGAYVDRSYNLVSSEEPVRILGSAVMGELFPILGVRPAIGRSFSPEEDRPGGPAVVLLGYDLWQERFRGETDVLGRHVRLNDRPHEIVGVMPEGFGFPYFGELWTPLQLDWDASARDDLQLGVIARLREGVTIDVAGHQLDEVAKDLEELHPDTNAGSGAELRELREGWMPTGGAQGRIAAASQLVLFLGLLLVICANVSGIVMAQATTRRSEWSLRFALGASRWQVRRQILVETSLLALCGGVAGGVLAARSDLILETVVPTTLPYWLDFSLGVRGVVWLVLVTVVAGLAVGILPALGATRRIGSPDALRSTTVGDLPKRNRLHGALIVAEYAVVVVILVQGLLVVKSFHNVTTADRGFDTENVLTLRLPLDGADSADPARRVAVLDAAVRGLRALPSIGAVGVTDDLPYLPVPSPTVTSLRAEGTTYPVGEEPRAVDHAVSSTFFEAIGLELSSGRTFTESEVRNGADRVVVSESVAEVLWPSVDPIDRRLQIGAAASGEWLRVVGVVSDIEPGQMVPGLGTMPRHRIYLPLHGTQAAPFGPPLVPTLVLATRVQPAEAVADVRRVLSEIAPGLPLVEIKPMATVLEDFYFAQHFWNRIFSGIAILTLLIAGIGVYGLTRYAVSKRVREMGIRLALGARPRSVLTLVMRRGTTYAFVGATIGLLVAVPLTLAMESFLQNVNGVDLGIYASVVIGMMLLALLASALPALRAARIDPIRSLRQN